MKCNEETKKKISLTLKGHKHSSETKKKISESLKGRKFSKTHRERIGEIHKGKKVSKETRMKLSEINRGKKASKETKMKLSEFQKFSIEQIKEKYPTFSKIEEMRYHPETGEIQVHCKNHNCENSKELGGWFKPKSLYDRIRCIEYGTGGSYFYCSENCKQECPLFNLRSDPFNINLPYNLSEYQTWRGEVFKRQKDEYGYNFCEYCETQENLESHHIHPIKIYPNLSLDPENGLICCKECHLNKAHINECSTGELANNFYNCSKNIEEKL